MGILLSGLAYPFDLFNNEHQILLLEGINMSQASANQKNLVIGLAVIVVLLAAIVGILILKPASTPAPTAATPATTAPTAGGTVDANGAATGGAAGTGMGQDAPFDKKTAQKIAADSTPQKWVEGYYLACDKKDWKVAWEHLPTAKRETTTEAALGEQLKGYGITGWKITGSSEKDGTLEISADQTTQYGVFTSVWTFVQDGKVWLLKSKKVAGMQ